jgi:hypothetical protein
MVNPSLVHDRHFLIFSNFYVAARVILVQSEFYNYWCFLNFGNNCKSRFAQVSLWQLRRNWRRSGNAGHVLRMGWPSKYLDYGKCFRKHNSERRLTWDDPLHHLFNIVWFITAEKSEPYDILCNVSSLLHIWIIGNVL